MALISQQISKIILLKLFLQIVLFIFPTLSAANVSLFNLRENSMHEKINVTDVRSSYLNSIKFFKYNYPKDHWAIDYTKAGTSIAHVKLKGKYNYSIILNPTDCRGYRTIIRYLNDSNSDIPSALNRPYTVAEERGLNEVTAMMERVYEKMGLIPQFAQLGNNSHSFDEKTRETIIGNEEEPGMLHLHLWGRGDPEHEFIAGVPLRGPKPGLMFDLIAKSKTEPTNQFAIKWDPKELEIALAAFKDMLSLYLESDEFKEEFSDSLEVSIDMTKAPSIECL
ncbi:hypothetical protein [Fluoribacter gormanii]|uniref:LPG0439 HIT-related domain-containing protein n=1 Tax=Fluoribacter gormanii TaxID=464 RepID=A0A377GJ19_9GAMM|nr:hypothetical protein [Fluoribacter gormanii]KTD01358.1 hypothetical protein Lgor_2424 [Fluoribacter gormanii]SIR48324.1 hypothetical protein SAMN05421777_11352 [Fluoribacter gormanii]STO24840.1 Uncharacterised protein [Fluoribacter gormanii]